jgi:hypothetical protein
VQGCFYSTVAVSPMVSHTVRAQPVTSATALSVLISESSAWFACVDRGGKDPTGWGITVTYISQSVGIVEGAIRATSAQHRWRQLQRLIQHSALILLSSSVAAASERLCQCMHRVSFDVLVWLYLLSWAVRGSARRARGRGGGEAPCGSPPQVSFSRRGCRVYCRK